MSQKRDVVSCIKELGYRELTPLQKKAFHEIVKTGKSVLISAPTGSGKTEAAVIPVMYLIKVGSRRPISCIYVTPLRALNRDIERRLRALAHCFDLRIAVRHGDTPASARQKIAEDPPHILVTTPETLTYLVVNEKMRTALGNVEFVIIDEFHELLESKRGALLLSIIAILESVMGRHLRKIALSATISEPTKVSQYLKTSRDEEVSVLSGEEARIMEIDVVIPSCDSLCKKVFEVVNSEDFASRISLIVDVARKHGNVLVFTNTRSLAEYLGAVLRNVSSTFQLGLTVDVHHGSLSRDVREDVEKRFREGGINVLVATSSVELGIDIGHIKYVVQYFSPRQVSRLLQRVGRSGHRLGEISRGAVISSDNLLHLAESITIVQRALRDLLEKEKVFNSPLDVLGYVIAVYSLIKPGGFGKNELFEILTKTELYKDLSVNSYIDVINYLSMSRIIREEGDKILPTRKTKLFVYKTSMIPSTRDMIVVELSTGKTIGTLNEEYVVVNLSPGELVVLGGVAWKVIGLDPEAGKLFVEKAALSDVATVPYWEGENIPVEYETAQGVGELISKAKRRSLEDLGKLAPLFNRNSIRYMGDARTIYIDYVERASSIIVNVYGGSRVNSFIRDIIKYLLKRWFPFAEFKVYSTPYYVLILMRGLVDPLNVVGVVETTLRSLGEYADYNKAMLVARDSQAIYWRIYQVAQRFGAISPGETRVSKQVLSAFIDTVIGREAVNEMLVRDYDIESFRDLAEKIKRGEVKVEKRFFKDYEAHHLELLGYIEAPFASRAKMPLSTEDYFNQLLNRELTLLCINCGYVARGRVKELMSLSSFSCPKCGLATLSVVKGEASREIEVVEKLKKGKVKGDERSIIDELATRASLLYRFGRNALLVFAGRGVGTSEAIRILNKMISGEDLVKEIYEAEKRFLSVKQYIDAKGSGKRHS